MIENTSIRHRQIVYLLRPSCAGSVQFRLAGDGGQPSQGISRNRDIADRAGDLEPGTQTHPSDLGWLDLQPAAVQLVKGDLAARHAEAVMLPLVPETRETGTARKEALNVALTS
jgi:hypothetical protein